MTMHPALRPMFDAQQSAPPLPADTPPAVLRAAMHAMIEQSYYALVTPQPPVAVERDIVIPVAGGEIALRLYRPEGDGALPAHVYYHGGGFFLGTLAHGDTACRAIVRDVGCAVVSVDYRLAPEHRFPTAAEDAYAAVRWVAAHAEALGIDPARLSVGGASAGGNLAAVTALLARDRGGPRIVAQLLEIPVTDFTADRALDFPAEGIAIGAAKGYAPLYLGDPADAHDPRASPLLAETLAGLPPALVLCAEYDQLCPEGEAYAARLSAAGVATECRTWPGQFHGAQAFDRVIPEAAADYRATIARFLRTALAAAA